MTGVRASGAIETERRIGRLLIGVTYVSVTLLLVGVVLLLGRGIAPLSGGPVLDLGRLPGDLLRADPAGFLWLGLLAIFAAPVSRVAVALIAYVREADWLMAGVSVAILLVLAIAVGSAVVSTV